MKKNKYVRFGVTLILLLTLFLGIVTPIKAQTGSSLTPTGSLTNQDFDDLNPLKIANTDPAIANRLSTPGGIISRLLSYAFPIAGFILFIMIVWGGFEMLLGATSKKMDAGRQRVTAAIIGFFLLFASFWIIRIVDQAFLGGNLNLFTNTSSANIQQGQSLGGP